MNTPSAQSIVERHQERLAGFPAQPAPVGNTNDPVYLAALSACSTLGFIAADALCLASAWLAQTRRLGHFDPDHWPDDPLDFGLLVPQQAQPFPSCPKALGLYAVVPDAQWVARMARIGVPTVQLRLKSTDHGAIQAQVQAAVKAVQGSHTHLFINDHWQAAIAAQAYGVHLGQEDLQQLQPAHIYALRNSSMRLGLSTHGYAEMVYANQFRPSYIAMGAVFPTTLKAMQTAPQGLARLSDYVRLMKAYPLVAIGGISTARLPSVLACGVGSIAVVRAIVQADEPEAAAQQLMRLMQDADHAGKR